MCGGFCLRAVFVLVYVRFRLVSLCLWVLEVRGQPSAKFLKSLQLNINLKQTQGKLQKDSALTQKHTRPKLGTTRKPSDTTREKDSKQTRLASRSLLLMGVHLWRSLVCLVFRVLGLRGLGLNFCVRIQLTFQGLSGFWTI